MLCICSVPSQCVECAGNKALSKAQNGGFVQPSLDVDPLNMLPTEEELLTCDCPFCVAYRGRSGSGRSIVTGHPLFSSDDGKEYCGCIPQQDSVHYAVKAHGVICCYAQSKFGAYKLYNLPQAPQGILEERLPFSLQGLRSTLQLMQLSSAQGACISHVCCQPHQQYAGMG